MRTRGFPSPSFDGFGFVSSTKELSTISPFCKCRGCRGQHPPAAIVLDSPFTSAADVGQRAYWFVPTRYLMKDTFNSMAHVAKITSPVFIFHGDADPVVPFQFGQTLYEAIRSPKEFLRLPGVGHVAPLTPDSWQEMKDFLENHTGSP